MFQQIKILAIASPVPMDPVYRYNCKSLDFQKSVTFDKTVVSPKKFNIVTDIFQPKAHVRIIGDFKNTHMYSEKSNVWIPNEYLNRYDKCTISLQSVDITQPKLQHCLKNYKTAKIKRGRITTVNVTERRRSVRKYSQSVSRDSYDESVSGDIKKFNQNEEDGESIACKHNFSHESEIEYSKSDNETLFSSIKPNSKKYSKTRSKNSTPISFEENHDMVICTRVLRPRKNMDRTQERRCNINYSLFIKQCHVLLQKIVIQHDLACFRNLENCLTYIKCLPFVQNNTEHILNHTENTSDIFNTTEKNNLDITTSQIVKQYPKDKLNCQIDYVTKECETENSKGVNLKNLDDESTKLCGKENINSKNIENLAVENVKNLEEENMKNIKETLNNLEDEINKDHQPEQITKEAISNLNENKHKEHELQTSNIVTTPIHHVETTSDKTDNALYEREQLHNYTYTANRNIEEEIEEQYSKEFENQCQQEILNIEKTAMEQSDHDEKLPHKVSCDNPSQKKDQIKNDKLCIESKCDLFSTNSHGDESSHESEIVHPPSSPVLQYDIVSSPLAPLTSGEESDNFEDRFINNSDSTTTYFPYNISSPEGPETFNIQTKTPNSDCLKSKTTVSYEEYTEIKTSPNESEHHSEKNETNNSSLLTIINKNDKSVKHGNLLENIIETMKTKVISKEKRTSIQNMESISSSNLNIEYKCNDEQNILENSNIFKLKPQMEVIATIAKPESLPDSKDNIEPKTDVDIINSTKRKTKKRKTESSNSESNKKRSRKNVMYKNLEEYFIQQPPKILKAISCYDFAGIESSSQTILVKPNDINQKSNNKTENKLKNKKKLILKETEIPALTRLTRANIRKEAEIINSTIIQSLNDCQNSSEVQVISELEKNNAAKTESIINTDNNIIDIDNFQKESCSKPISTVKENEHEFQISFQQINDFQRKQNENKSTTMRCNSSKNDTFQSNTEFLDLEDDSNIPRDSSSKLNTFQINNSDVTPKENDDVKVTFCISNMESESDINRFVESNLTSNNSIELKESSRHISNEEIIEEYLQDELVYENQEKSSETDRVPYTDETQSYTSEEIPSPPFETVAPDINIIYESQTSELLEEENVISDDISPLYEVEIDQKSFSTLENESSISEMENVGKCIIDQFNNDDKNIFSDDCDDFDEFRLKCVDSANLSKQSGLFRNKYNQHITSPPNQVSSTDYIRKSRRKPVKKPRCYKNRYEITETAVSSTTLPNNQQFNILNPVLFCGTNNSGLLQNYNNDLSQPTLIQTPSITPKPKRGRPKGSKNKNSFRSPTLPVLTRYEYINKDHMPPYLIALQQCSNTYYNAEHEFPTSSSSPTHIDQMAFQNPYKSSDLNILHLNSILKKKEQNQARDQKFCTSKRKSLTFQENKSKKIKGQQQRLSESPPFSLEAQFGDQSDKAKTYSKQHIVKNVFVPPEIETLIIHQESEETGSSDPISQSDSFDT